MKSTWQISRRFGRLTEMRTRSAADYSVTATLSVVSDPLKLCENEFRNTLEFVEVKRSRERIDLDALRVKAEAFLQKNPDRRDREISYAGWSLEEM